MFKLQHVVCVCVCVDLSCVVLFSTPLCCPLSSLRCGPPSTNTLAGGGVWQPPAASLWPTSSGRECGWSSLQSVNTPPLHWNTSEPLTASLLPLHLLTASPPFLHHLFHSSPFLLFFCFPHFLVVFLPFIPSYYLISSSYLLFCLPSVSPSSPLILYLFYTSSLAFLPFHRSFIFLIFCIFLSLCSAPIGPTG